MRQLIKIRTVLAAIVFLSLGLVSTTNAAKTPDCSGSDRWPTMSTLVLLKNAGLIDPVQLDHEKTKVSRLASEKIGKDLYQQVHLITFELRSGERLQVVATNQVSSDECSMSDVTAFIVSRKIGADIK